MLSLNCYFYSVFLTWVNVQCQCSQLTTRQCDFWYDFIFLFKFSTINARLHQEWSIKITIKFIILMEQESPHLNYNDNDRGIDRITSKIFFSSWWMIKTLTANQNPALNMTKLQCNVLKINRMVIVLDVNRLLPILFCHSEADMGAHITWRTVAAADLLKRGSSFSA